MVDLISTASATCSTGTHTVPQQYQTVNHDPMHPGTLLTTLINVTEPSELLRWGPLDMPSPSSLWSCAALVVVLTLLLYGFNLHQRIVYRNLPGPTPQWLLGNALPVRGGSPFFPSTSHTLTT